MDYRDYYKLLGVEKTASEAEIKRAYRQLARKLHPDVNPGDAAAESRFKEINEAYEVLSDPDKRSKYDRLGSSWRQWQRAGRDPGGFDWSQWSAPGGGVHIDLNDFMGASGGFSDFFNSLFGGVAGGGRPRGHYRPIRGRNVEQPIEISLQEAFEGTQRTLERGGKRIQAQVPAGAYSGARIRLAGQGQPSGGGQPGDLYLKVSVRNHPTLERQGDDLFTEMPIDLYTAVLGGEITVEALDGRFELKIPPGTQGGQRFRLRGKGMPNMRQKDQRGDLYVRILVQIPIKLSRQEKQLFQQLADLHKG